MRIAFLTDWMRRGAGVAVAVTNLADALVRAGHDVVLCGPDPATAEAVLERRPAFETRPLPPLPPGPLARARAVSMLTPAIESVRADVYVPATFPFERLADGLTPTVLYDHGAVPALGAPPRLAAALLYVAASTRGARRRAAGVVTVSNWLAREVIRDRGSDDVAVVPNGIDHCEPLSHALPARAEARRRLGLPTAAKVVLTVGRCGPDAHYKGLAAVAGALGERDFYRGGGSLIAVGPADAADRRRLTRRGVTALGTLDAAGLAAAYAAADVCVSASRWEGFNLPLLEAQYLGVPVLALDRCAHPEVVHRRAALVPDVERLAAAIAAFKPPPARELAAAATFARSFSWERSATLFAAAVEPLAASDDAHGRNLPRPRHKI